MDKSIETTPCYCLKLHRSTENVISFYNHILEPSGITIRQYSILTSIKVCGEGSISKLAAMNELDRSTMSRNLTPLLRQGLIANKKEPGQRNNRISITEAGEKILIQAEKLWNNAQEQFEEVLGEEGIPAFHKVLTRISDLQ